MLEACARPDLVTEITLQPVRRHGVDAAVLFSDIVVPLKAVGVDLDIKPGVGPVIARPIRSAADLDQLRPLEPDDVSYVAEAVRALVGELGATPLVGFAGAPFTLASYLVEGGPSRNHEHTKALMYGAPQVWDELMARLAAITAAFLHVQVAAGAVGRAAVRLVGRCAARDRLRPPRAAALGRGARLARADRRPAHPLRRRHRRAAGAHGRGRGRRHGRGLPAAAGRGRPPHRPWSRRAGQPRPGRAVRALGGGGRAHPGRPGRWAGGTRATCSTSATA